MQSLGPILRRLHPTGSWQRAVACIFRKVVCRPGGGYGNRGRDEGGRGTRATPPCPSIGPIQS